MVERYNIEKTKGEEIEQKFSNARKRFDRVRRDVSAGVRMAGAAKEEFDDYSERLNTFIWGDNPPVGGPRKKHERHEQHEQPSRRSPRTPASENKGYSIVIITKHDIERVMKDVGISPKDVPEEFIDDVAASFNEQLLKGLEPYLDEHISKVIAGVDREYTRRYGRKS